MMSLFGGDFKFLWEETVKEFAQPPTAWDSILNTGLGIYNVPLLWINTYVSFTTALGFIGIPWIGIVLLFWTLPVFVCSFFFSFLLFRYLFPSVKSFSFIAGLIYAVNTYILMVVLGGQMGVGLAYAVVPLVLYTFVKTFAKPTLRNALIAGLALGLLILFDPRFVYMTMLVIGCYWLFTSLKFNLTYITICFITPVAVALLLHTFWVLPLFLHRGSGGIPVDLGTLKSFAFFSFADFSHTFGLLHPNWPENIFGKTYFMRWEYLLLPIIAFSSLLFVNKNNLSEKRAILFFSLLGLVGAFLAKGDNEPFQQVNQFLFTSFPGMQMFRDSTKWYTLTALAYSMLVPFAIFYAAKWVTPKFEVKYRKYLPILISVCVVLYGLFLLSPLVTSQNSVLKVRTIPDEYRQLKDFLHTQPMFFRTLWFPQIQRYGYYSYNHPAVSPAELFRTDKRQEMLKRIAAPDTQKLLQEASVKYIIVPFDSEKEIFVNGSKFSEKQYADTLRHIRSIDWLEEIPSVKGFHIFVVKNYKEHFWVQNSDTKLEYTRQSPTSYKVEVTNAKQGDRLVFSEGYDSGWKTQVDTNQVSSMKYTDRFNSFILPKQGNYELEVFYEPQKWVNLGMLVSVVTLLSVGTILIRSKKRKTSK